MGRHAPYRRTVLPLVALLLLVIITHYRVCGQSLLSVTTAGYFSCSAMTTENSYDTVTVVDPVLIEIKTGCTIRALVLSCTTGVRSTDLQLLIDNSRLNRSLEIRCDLDRANITLRQTAVGCESADMPANASSSTLASLPWLPRPTAEAGDRGIVIYGSVERSHIVITDSCVTTSDDGSVLPAEAFLRSAFVLSGEYVRTTNITVEASALIALARNLSSATVVHVQPQLVDSNFAVHRSLLVARCVGSVLTSQLAPWPAEAHVLRFFDVGTGASFAASNSSLLASAVHATKVSVVQFGTDRAQQLASARVAAAMDATVMVSAASSAALERLLDAAVVNQFLVSDTRFETSLSITNATYAANVFSSAITIDGALGLRVSLTRSAIVMLGVGNYSGLLINSDDTSAFELSSLTLHDVYIDVSLSMFTAGSAVWLRGALRRSLIYMDGANVTATAFAGNGTNGDFTAVRLGSGKASSANSSVRLVSAAVTVSPLATHATANALVIGSAGFNNSAFDMTSCSLRQLLNNANVTAVLYVAGVVRGGAFEWRDTTIIGLARGVVWNAGGSNTTRFMLDTVTFQGFVTAPPLVWVASPSWGPPGGSRSVYLVSRCVRRNGVDFSPAGTTLALTCAQCVVWLWCDERYTKAAPVVSGACTCTCFGNISARYEMNAKCVPLDTKTYSQSSTPSGITKTTFVSWTRPPSRTSAPTRTRSSEKP
jgi:hypothetical protein